MFADCSATPAVRPVDRGRLGTLSAMLSLTAAAPLLSRVAPIAAADEPWLRSHLLVPTGGPIGNLEGALFGSTVALDGDLVLIGAPTARRDSGHVFVFDVASGNLKHQLTNPDSPATSRFGSALDLNERWIAVGAAASSRAADEAGAVHLFDRASGELTITFTLFDAVRFEGLGNDVILRDDVCIASAPGDFAGVRSAGAVYLLDPAIEAPPRLYRPDVPPARDDFYGSGIASSGDRLLVGASGRATTWGSDGGAAYVIDIQTGETLFELVPESSSSTAAFGSAVACSGTWAVVGAFRDGPSVSSGSVYVFDMMTGEQLRQLVPEDATAGMDFGRTLAVDGGIAIIGAPRDGSVPRDTGSAYRFDLASGRQMQKFLPFDPVADDQYGSTVALNGHTAVIATPYSDLVALNAGVAMIYVAPRRSLTVSPDLLTSGEDAFFTLSNLRPHAPTWMLFTFEGLDPEGFYIAALDISIDLIRPHVMWGPELSGDDRTLAVQARMPGVSGPRNIWFQGVQHSKVTSTVSTRIQP